MTLVLVTSPIATKSISSVDPALLSQTSVSADPASVGLASTSTQTQSVEVFPDDPFAIPGGKFKYSPNPDVKTELNTETKSESKTDEVAPQVSTSGEPVQDATAILLSLDEQSALPLESDSFLVSYWPYLLLVMAFVGWVMFQLVLKQPPQYKPERRPHPKSQPSSKQPAGVNGQSSGQFKVSQRFQKKKSVSEKKGVPEKIVEMPQVSRPVSRTKPIRVVYSNDDERPSDEEFEIGDGAGISDSDIMDSEEAAEIVKSVESRAGGGQTEVSSSRFKTETNQQKSLPNEES